MGVGYICWRARRVYLGGLEQSLGVWANDYQPRNMRQRETGEREREREREVTMNLH